MKNDPVLKLNQKPHTPYGIVSLCLGLVSLILVIITITITASNDTLTHVAQIIVGSLEGVSAMLCIAGIGVSIVGEGAKEMERLFVHISLLLHLILFVYHSYVVWFGFIA